MKKEYTPFFLFTGLSILWSYSWRVKISWNLFRLHVKWQDQSYGHLDKTSTQPTGTGQRICHNNGRRQMLWCTMCAPLFGFHLIKSSCLSIIPMKAIFFGSFQEAQCTEHVLLQIRMTWCSSGRNLQKRWIGETWQIYSVGKHRFKKRNAGKYGIAYFTAQTLSRLSCHQLTIACWIWLDLAHYIFNKIKINFNIQNKCYMR